MKDTIKNLHGQIDAQEKEKYMYYHLVKSDDDVVGMIAYSKYKSAKIEYIVSVKKRTGKKPTDADLENFQQSQTSTDTIEGYKLSALKLFETFQAVAFEEHNKEYEKKKKDLEREEKKISKIKSLCPADKQVNFWLSVWASALSSILLGAIFVILWFTQLIPNLIEFINSIKK